MTLIIQAASMRSMLTDVFVNNQRLGSATSFVVEYQSEYYLVSNRHVIAGRRWDDHQLLSPTGAVPAELRIHVPDAKRANIWTIRGIPLFDGASPLWRESCHRNGRITDIAALALGRDDRWASYAYSLDETVETMDIVVEVTSDVFIVGFPNPIRDEAGFPVWSRGSIATEPDYDYDSRPVFLVDCRTKPGQSGSPVIVHYPAGSRRPTRHGVSRMSGRPISILVGVYSGRINGATDLGLVWKVDAILDVIRNGVSPAEN